MKRTCNGCTKCCEGWLSGEAKGIPFFKGRPCQFVSIGKGCSIYKDRPLEPCTTYQCGWIKNPDIPEWMKPSEVDAIVDFRELDGMKYLNIVESGKPLSVSVLGWCIQYATNKGLNLVWEYEGGRNWVGTKEFDAAMRKEQAS